MLCRFAKEAATPNVQRIAITDHHSDTTFFSYSEHTGFRWIPWSIGSKKLLRHVPQVGVKPSIPSMNCKHSIHSGSVYSNSRNDVPRVAQRYGTIATHTRRRASVLVVFVVFCVHMHSFAGLIRRTPPPTFSDTAITDRHSDTTIFQLRAHWVWISWSIGSEKSFEHMPPMGVEPSTPWVQGEHPIH